MATQQEQPIRLAPSPGARVRRFFDAFIIITRSNPNVLIGVVILTAILLMTVFSPIIVRSDYTQTTTDLRLPPSSEHWFGTDAFGRDVFDRVIAGSRVSLYVGFAVTFISVVLGLVIALFAGYFRLLDHILMRFVDGLLAFPTILLALALIALLGGSVNNVIIALSVTGTASKVRLVRGQVLSLREEQFVEAARAIGAPVWRILFLHIAPKHHWDRTGAGDIYAGDGDSCRSEPQFPRSRGAGVHTYMGQYCCDRQGLCAGRLLDILLPRRIPDADRAGSRAHRRRFAGLS